LLCGKAAFYSLYRIELKTGHPRTKGLDKADIHVYSKNITSNAEASKVFEHYPKLIRVPFTGITTNGTKLNGVYSPQSGAPTNKMVFPCWTMLRLGYCCGGSSCYFERRGKKESFI
jgi:hypothetical protein